MGKINLEGINEHFAGSFTFLLQLVRIATNVWFCLGIIFQVSIRPVREAYEIDANNVTLKAMPGITECHLNPNGFEKMRVSIAFQLFGARVLQAFHLYRNELDKIFGTINATQEFFR